MTLLRALLISSAIIVSVQSFPSTTKNYEKESTLHLETKETTDTIPIYTQDLPAMLEKPVDSKEESSTVEFVFKNPKEGLSVRKGATHEKYTIFNLHSKNDAAKLNAQDSNKANEIDTSREDVLHKFNITSFSKSGDLLAEAQIKGDMWLFNPQEMPSIMGGLPKYFYDAAKPIYPFPEVSLKGEGLGIESKKENLNFQMAVAEISNQPPKTGGPLLYPQSVFSREIDVPFY